MIPYGRQSISQEDLDAVAEVLRGDWLTQGPAIERFEEAVAEYVGARFAVAFSSGTAALHGAAAAAGLGPGDTVVTSPLTFMASANCARYVGAEPTVVDIEAASWNIDLALVPDDVAAVVPVHYAGLPVDLAGFGRGSRTVIEDAAHALGALTPDGPVGNCTHSDMCCFSTHPVKPITTGEGGVVTTNDDELAARLRRFRSHGIIRRPEHGEWFYDIAEVGFNYRMTDIQAALGASQLGRIDEFIERRNDIALAYRRELSGLPIELPPSAPDGARHGYHLFPIAVENRAAVFHALRDRGIGVQVHYVPVHHHPISAHMGFGVGDLPVCDALYERLISLPIHPGLLDQDQRVVVDVLSDLLT